jgi:kynurenine formamidase
MADTPGRAESRSYTAEFTDRTGEGPIQDLNRRTPSRRTVDELIAKYRNWGEWGADDELGSANYVSPERIMAAASLIRRGTVFSLALPMDDTGPQTGAYGRNNPQHFMLQSGADIAFGSQNFAGGLGVADDAIVMPLQSSTQWDSLAHIFHDGKMYNDRGPEHVDSGGAHFNAITNFKDRAVGRGVLLDVPRFKERPWLEPQEAIQAEDLEACAAAQGVEIGEGDFVLVRTGQIAQCRANGGWGDYAGGPAPGLGLSAAEYLCPRRVTAVASDTWGVEAMPYETDDVFGPLHIVILVNAGIYIGEMWDMETLAEDCAADGVYEFFIAAQPLTVTGGVGSPINPLAIK